MKHYTLRMSIFPMIVLLLAAGWPTEAAAGPMPEPELKELLRSLLLPSPYRLSPSARAGTIRYRLMDTSGSAEWPWPETGEQQVRWAKGEVVLTICQTCGQEAAPTEAELQRYRSPAPMLESDDPAIVRFARSARGGSVDAQMRRLATAVREHFTDEVVYGSYLSAREALVARIGDCTEFALLLAAAGRANRIPTRVVAGLAYGSRFVGEPHAFGPHMWVQAWNGERWVSYDAGLGRFGAGHLALVLGDGSPESLKGTLDLISRLRIVDVTGVRSAGADANKVN